MKIEDMRPGKFYRVTRIDKPMEFSRVGGTGLAILHESGEPDMQSCIAVAAEDCAPWDGVVTVQPSGLAGSRNLHLDDFRRLCGGGSTAVTTLVVDTDGYVQEYEITYCGDKQWSWTHGFVGVTPNPSEAFERCLLHGAPSLKRDERGRFNQAELEAARAKFFVVTR